MTMLVWIFASSDCLDPIVNEVRCAMVGVVRSRRAAGNQFEHDHGKHDIHVASLLGRSTSIQL